ncbi:outer membrane protein assembly factor BamB family protein [Nannocystis bainbridge]|uniref:Pyrrolo-quinoline quinone repeat domain-containing protein n=1 Tax=Nannocystis bainbridge TaxID=2995303 RepID=A0ABT5DQ43_9BACT|nr:PQQ-binding-like beta-propeller repeat protein [Nannocystis bainbridge]MDC0715770.1 hypothetical protein [Nannocystis bainbridge]
MSKQSSGLQSVAKLTSALHTPRYLDAGAIYWSSDDFRFAAASLAGDRLWDVEVEDGSRLVGVFEGHPVVLTSRLDPPYALALVFLDPASGREVRRVAAPEDAAEAAYCDGVFGFLTASERLGATNRLVLADAASGRFETVAEGGLATGLTAIAGGFLCSLDFRTRAHDRKGRLMWTTDHVVTASRSALLATHLGGKLARLRPEDGAPLWQFTFKGAEARSLVQVHASADAVAVLEPRLGDLALLDLATGALRWRARRVASQSFAPPLVTTDAVVTLTPNKSGGALAAFALADGSLRAELPNRHGLHMGEGLVAGEVCVLGQAGGTVLQVIRVPAASTAKASPGRAERPSHGGTEEAGAAVGETRDGSAGSAKKAAAKKRADSGASVDSGAKAAKASADSAKTTNAVSAGSVKKSTKKNNAVSADSVKKSTKNIAASAAARKTSASAKKSVAKKAASAAPAKKAASTAPAKKAAAKQAAVAGSTRKPAAKKAPAKKK